jgi:type IV secretory pathway VirB2 component (pilin)
MNPKPALTWSLTPAGIALSTTAHAAEPAGASPILSAVTWMQDTLLGEVASGVAVIAVAVVGLMMLSGRLNWRYGATVIVGCFVLFGAATIVGGIRAAAG